MYSASPRLWGSVRMTPLSLEYRVMPLRQIVNDNDHQNSSGHNANPHEGLPRCVSNSAKAWQWQRQTVDKRIAVTFGRLSPVRNREYP
jgi:hypothetical protein